MTVAETDDFATVLLDPAAWYHHPQAVVDDTSLSQDEKRALLTEWEQDVADRSAAADEGMVPEVPGIIDRDVKIQDRLAAARTALEAQADTEFMSLPQRLWRRIAGTA